MAPAKNPNAANKISGNSNAQSLSNIPLPGGVANNAANCHLTSSSSSTQRKPTGTVPKTSAKSTTSTNATAGGQKILLQPSSVSQVANRCSPLNVVASVQQHHSRTQQHKNTEIVAPIRRELKDFNVSLSIVNYSHFALIYVV